MQCHDVQQLVHCQIHGPYSFHKNILKNQRSEKVKLANIVEVPNVSSSSLFIGFPDRLVRFTTLLPSSSYTGRLPRLFFSKQNFPTYADFLGSVRSMCICNYQDPEEDLPEWPIPLGHPQLTWAIPVDIRKLGASLEAFADTLPRVTTLQLIHRFRDGPLSKIPQELLEQIIITVHRQAMKTFRSSWKTPFYCYRGVCHPNDHGETYNEHIESLWQRFFVDDDNIKLDEFEGITKDDCTPEQKLKMVENWMERDPSLEVDEYLWELHFMMRTEWVTKTCLCSVPGRSTGKFVPLNKVIDSLRYI